VLGHNMAHPKAWHIDQNRQYNTNNQQRHSLSL
jgi:hypothetical protein